MADLLAQAVASTSIHLRWREPYVTEGVAVTNTGLIPGVHRGMWLDEAAVPTTAVRIRATGPGGTVAGVHSDSFLVYADAASGYALAVQEAADVVLDLTALFPVPAGATWWIWADVTYAANVVTTASYHVSSTDPRVAHPNAVVLGVLTVAAGAADIRITSAVINTTVSYANRTIPQATKREVVADYVAGDRTVGLMTGEDRWVLPTINEKDALDGAATAATAANPYVTEADTLDKVWGEPTVVTVALAAGASEIDLDFATYGAFYVGTGAVGTAQRYVDIRQEGLQDAVRLLFEENSEIGNLIYVDAVYKIGTAVELIPTVDADAAGFYSGGVTLGLSYKISNGACNVDVWYARKRIGATLAQAPAYGLATAQVPRWDHADRVGVRGRYAPPSCRMEPDAMLGDEIENLLMRARGSHSNLLTEENLAACINVPASTQAQVCGSGSEATLGAALYPRRMCYGFNAATSTRYLLYTATNGGVEKIAQRTVTHGTFGSITYINPVPTVHAAATALGHQPAAQADWRIVSLASDGQYVYIRLFATTGAAPAVHYVACYDIVSNTSRWTPVEIASGVAGYWYATRFNALHICAVDSTHFAVNREWEDLKTVGIGHGIEVRLKADGSLVATGYGNATQAGWTEADAYAAGPMTSDGTNIYFTVRCYDSGAGAYTGHNMYEVAQCLISNPQTYNIAAVNDLVDLETWNPNTATFHSNPRGLVFDGKYVWLSTRFGIMVVNPVAAGAEVHFTRIDHGAKYQIFGHLAFDGKHLYVGVADVEASLFGVTGGKYHLVRYTPATLPSNGTGGTIDDFDAYIDPSFMWQMESLVSMPVDWSAEYMFGDMAYDGETLWWTKQWWNATNVMTARELVLQRLTNVHGV